MPHHSEPNQKQQLRLISVAFKEASVDSPSFRATVNFFHTRIDIFEEWVEKSIAFYEQKYTHSFDDFHRTQNALISQLFPSASMLSTGLVSNQGFTPSLVNTFTHDFADFSERMLKILNCNDLHHSTPLMELMTNAIDPYKTCRKNFDYYQSKYDSTLFSFQATNIRDVNIDPNTTKSDAMHLFALHKSYLEASLELVEAIYKLRLQIDKFLLDTMNNIKSDATLSFKDGSKPADLMPSTNEYMMDYNMWIQNAIDGARALESDIENAKKQAYDYTINHITPSDDVRDYDVQHISPNSLISNVNFLTNKPPELSGWLYMKTYVGTPSREIWVHRWCFLQNGIFGTLLLAPSKTYVEETDKFGVFLTSVRYKPEESRKFCFEVRIFNGRSSDSHDPNKNVTLVFQAKCLKDLKGWLNAFESSKKTISGYDRNSLAYDIAYRRFSPKYIEFASSTTTKIDQQITTFDENTESLFQIYQCSFSEYEVLTIADEKIYKFQTVLTPMSTKMTNIAFLASHTAYGTYCMNAIVANIWGTTNWSDYSLILSPVPSTNTDKSLKISSRCVSAHDKIIYPPYYPPSLKFYDLQFKNLFLSIDQRLAKIDEEFLLFKFDSFWCPNKKQRFSSVCYVTQNNLYSYINSVGFICLTRVRLEDLVSIDKDKTSRTLVRIHNISGLQLRVHVLFTDPEAVASKLQYLLEQKTASSKTDLPEIFAKFAEIDREIELKTQKQKEALENSEDSVYDLKAHGIDAKVDTLEATFWNMTTAKYELLTRRKNLEKSSTTFYRHHYDIPCKGLMHILFGDESQTFPGSLFLSRKTGTRNVNWYWKKKSTDEDGNVILTRNISFAVEMTDNFLTTGKYYAEYDHEIVLQQSIIKAIENKYYEVDQSPILLKLPLSRIIKVSTKYIISEDYDPEKHIESKLKMPYSGSSLHVLYNIEFLDPKTGEAVTDLHFLERVYRDWIMHFSGSEFLSIRKSIRYYLEKMGKHGKVIKAMRLCGLIGISEEPPLDDEKEAKAEDGGLARRTKSPLSEEIDTTTKSTDSEAVTTRKEYDVRYTTGILTKVLLKRFVYRIANVFFFLFRVLISAFLKSSSIVRSLNRALLMLLFVSVLFNVFLSGRSTLNYWSVKTAEKKFKNFLHDSGKFSMQRSIKIDELDLLTEYLAVDQNNLAYNKFQETLEQIDGSYRYKETRKEVAIKRNELLVELRILQNMERELVQGDYKKFLIEEVDRCIVAKREVSDIFNNDANIQEYCTSCENELTRISRLLL